MLQNDSACHSCHSLISWCFYYFALLIQQYSYCQACTILTLCYNFSSAGAGIGLGFPGLQVGFGVGAGCGVGVGFDYGLGIGRAYDDSGSYSNVGMLPKRSIADSRGAMIGALLDDLVSGVKRALGSIQNDNGKRRR